MLCGILLCMVGCSAWCIGGFVDVVGRAWECVRSGMLCACCSRARCSAAPFLPPPHTLTRSPVSPPAYPPHQTLTLSRPSSPPTTRVRAWGQRASFAARLGVAWPSFFRGSACWEMLAWWRARLAAHALPDPSCLHASLSAAHHPSSRTSACSLWCHPLQAEPHPGRPRGRQGAAGHRPAVPREQH